MGECVGECPGKLSWLYVHMLMQD